MLGSDVLSVRLGGIYALQHLAEEYPEQYHVPIMRLFCAFARHPTKDDSEVVHLDGEKYPRPREDAQAVMIAIGTRSKAGLDYEKAGGFRLDLLGADLHGASLSGANLSGANLRGANLDHAHLSEADLSGAHLTSINLANANLIQANLSDAHLLSANLSHTISQHIDLSRVDLGGANLSDARLEWADLSDANVGTANLSRACLRNTNLSGAVFGRGTRVTASDPPISEDIFARLTQTQLDEARADPDNPPKIDGGTVDTETGKPLVWRGKSRSSDEP